jgi:hypothetical protein
VNQLPASVDWTVGSSHAGSPTFDEQVRLFTSAGWGPWTDAAAGISHTMTAALLQGATGYQFRTRAQIGALVSGWTTGTSRKPWRVIHSAGSVSYSGSWQTVRSGPASWHESTKPGSSASLTTRGTSYGVQLSTGAGTGVVKLCVDPTRLDRCISVDLSTLPVSSGRTIVVVNDLAAMPHTLVLTVVSGRVDLAAFVGLTAVP